MHFVAEFVYIHIIHQILSPVIHIHVTDRWKLVENGRAVSFNPDVLKPSANGDFYSFKHVFNASVQYLTSNGGQMLPFIIGCILTVIVSTCLSSGGSRKGHFSEVPPLPSNQRRQEARGRHDRSSGTSHHLD